MRFTQLEKRKMQGFLFSWMAFLNRTKWIVAPFALVEAFFLDEQNVYLISDGQVCKVNRTTGKTDIIMEGIVIQSLSFDGTNIYYSNEKSKLIQHNVDTGEESEVYGIVTESFLLTNEAMVFMNRLEQNRLYAIKLADGTLRQLTQAAVLSFTISGNTIIYTEKANLQEHKIVINKQ